MHKHFKDNKKIKCLTHNRATHSSISDALSNTVYTEQSIVCVHICLQCTSTIGKGSQRGTIDEIAIYNRVSNRKSVSMQNEFTSVILSRPTLGKIETTPQIGKDLENVHTNAIIRS